VLNAKLSSPPGSNPSGCLSDLYPFVGVARNDGSGSNSMGFYNVLKGDAPVFKRIADEYTINDNYHQPVMGGTAVQHIMLGTPTHLLGYVPGSYPTADSQCRRSRPEVIDRCVFPA
jgi:phospholipase C